MNRIIIRLNVESPSKGFMHTTVRSCTRQCALQASPRAISCSLYGSLMTDASNDV